MILVTSLQINGARPKLIYSQQMTKGAIMCFLGSVAGPVIQATPRHSDYRTVTVSPVSLETGIRGGAHHPPSQPTITAQLFGQPATGEPYTILIRVFRTSKSESESADFESENFGL
jgi:hypothetical protein